MNSDNASEEFLYFTCEWIIDFDEFKSLIDAFDISKKSPNLLLAFRHTMTLDGFEAERLVLRTPDVETFNQFSKQIPHALAHLEWVPISESLVFQHRYSLDPRLYEYHFFDVWMQGLSSASFRNKKLRTRLEKQPAKFFACDWIVPDKLASHWSTTLLDSYQNVRSLGSELRFSQGNLTTTGYHTMRFLIRVYSEKELRITAKGVQLEEKWFPVKAEEFLNAKPISQNTDDCVVNLKELDKLLFENSAMNKSLKEKK